MKNAKNSHQWTKEDVKKVIKLWDSMTKEEIALELDITESQVGSMAFRIRKAGGNLAKKHRKGLCEELIKEAILEVKKGR